jgi:hypothetical protein
MVSATQDEGFHSCAGTVRPDEQRMGPVASELPHP